MMVVWFVSLFRLLFDGWGVQYVRQRHQGGSWNLRECREVVVSHVYYR